MAILSIKKYRYSVHSQLHCKTAKYLFNTFIIRYQHHPPPNLMVHKQNKKTSSSLSEPHSTLPNFSQPKATSSNIPDLTQPELNFHNLPNFTQTDSTLFNLNLSWCYFILFYFKGSPYFITLYIYNLWKISREDWLTLVMNIMSGDNSKVRVSMMGDWKFPVTPMGVLAPGSAHARPWAEIVGRTCLQNHLRTSPPTPQKSYPKFRDPRTTFEFFKKTL